MNASDQRDYYEILGIKYDASQQEIRDIYRKLAFQYHPDRNKDDPRANEKMKAINEAYATLSDQIKRQEYDLLRERYGPSASTQFRQTHSQADIFRNSDIEQIFNEFSRSFGFRNADEVIRQFYGKGFTGYVYQRPGFDFRSYIYNNHPGTGTSSTSPSPTNKPGCANRLIRFIYKKVFKIQVPERGKDIVDILHLDPELARAGGEVEYNYRRWGKPRNLMVKIPRGIKNKQTIRLREMGYPGKSGGVPGDLLLTVKIKGTLYRRIRSFFKV